MKKSKSGSYEKVYEKWEAGFDITKDPSGQKDLVQRLHFDFSEGVIRLDSHRVILLQAEWFKDLGRELIEKLGFDVASGIFRQLGILAGSRYATGLMTDSSLDTKQDIIFAGVRLHGLNGLVSARPLVFELDEETDHFYAEFLWKNSIELGIEDSNANGSLPGCWSEVGYAEGFLSTCLGKPVVVHEIECRRLGHDCCRGIAQFSDEAYFSSSPSTATGDKAVTGALRSSAVEAPESGLASGFSKLKVPLDAPIANGVIGSSSAFNAILHQVNRVASTDAAVLLLGESGVGKSAIAREIHRNSLRAEGPFVELNCPAVPESLIEAELFGVEKGAYTGAEAQRSGRFDAAQGGTLFLDEIGTLSLSAQAKLLRVLQTFEFERLGSSETRIANVRLITATNEDLKEAVEEGRFRLDLYYRLNVFPINIPPLRERREDIPDLISFFLNYYSSRHRLKVDGVSTRAYRAMLSYDWPGNIRELENILERAVILCGDGAQIDLPHVFSNSDLSKCSKLHWLNDSGDLTTFRESVDFGDSSEGTDWTDIALSEEGSSFEELERKLIMRAIKDSDDNVAKAARRLGLTRGQIDYRLKKWGCKI